MDKRVTSRSMIFISGITVPVYFICISISKLFLVDFLRCTTMLRRFNLSFLYSGLPLKILAIYPINQPISLINDRCFLITQR